LARDGTVFVAWFSDRNNNPDIYVASTRDRRTWSVPVRVTTNPAGDFYPNLIQDDQGLIHLTWFQWVALEVGQIRHSTSTNGVDWTPEEAVTTTLSVDDWVPSIAQAPNGTLVVYFVSDKRDQANPTNEIYLAAKPPGATAWQPAVPVAGLNSPTHHDHLPFAARIGTGIALVWVRHDTRARAPWLTPAPKSDLFVATSTNGIDFGAPRQITRDAGDLVHVFPAWYSKHDGSWWLLWLSTRSGRPTVVEMPVAGLDRYPDGLVEVSWLPSGYSHRVSATPGPNEYLGAWVQGPDGAQDIYWRTTSR
jgi:hypothetical protein